MKNQAKFFEFTSYKLDAKNRSIRFDYKIEFATRAPLFFCEKIILPAPFSISTVPPKFLDTLLSDLHIMLGINYYKLYCPSKVKSSYNLPKGRADFWNAIYKKGLGEFLYRNKIDPEMIAKFPASKGSSPVGFRLKRKKRALIGIGGGKDSVVATELLKKQKIDGTAFVVETQEAYPIVDNLIQELKIGQLKIKRQMDEKIFAEHPGAYNGHVPISAMFAFLGYLAAVLYDYSYVIVANEYSSNFGNTTYKGENVNHQWSKSSEFEKLFQDYARKFLSPDILYFSLLRNLHEIRIAEIFSRYKKYFPFFTSCNRNFRIKKTKPDSLWCGECPKCAFSFLMFSAFLNKKELTGFFGKNLFTDERLLPLFADILGFGKMKPFDCVGTFEESRVALFLARKNFADSLVVKTFLPKIKNPENLVGEVFLNNAAPEMPAYFRLFSLKNILILGYGKDGCATEKYLQKHFPDIKVAVSDGQLDQNYLKKQKKYDLAIKTPGMPKELVTIPYVTSMDIFFSQVKNRIIGVTGSKGKSTTASLIYTILKEAGYKASLLGNIGNPVLEALMRSTNPEEIFVVELSSYQLDDIHHSPQVAVALSLFPEHMNYHGNVEKYYAAKKNITNFQKPGDYFIYNSVYKDLKKWAKETEAESVDFSKLQNFGNIKSHLLGKHNQDNIQAAVAVAKVFNISDKVIRKAVAAFKPLSHRLELVGEYRGIKFYDDAISTTPESTMAALAAIPDVATIMLGGEDRGYDFSKLEKALKKYKIRNIILFPDSGKRILKNRKDFNILETTSMSEAVKFAAKNTPSGKVCLLSTASPSYSLWKNFEEKGDKFKAAVKRLK